MKKYNIVGMVIVILVSLIGCNERQDSIVAAQRLGMRDCHITDSVWAGYACGNDYYAAYEMTCGTTNVLACCSALRGCSVRPRN